MALYLTCLPWSVSELHLTLYNMVNFLQGPPVSQHRSNYAFITVVTVCYCFILVTVIMTVKSECHVS